MSDDQTLVKRLRRGQYDVLCAKHIPTEMTKEAADRIEKLEMTARGVPIRDMTALSKALDRIEKLEAALRKYADEEYNGYNADGAHARKALEDSQ